MTKKTSFIVGAVVVIVAVVLIAVFSGHAPEGSVSSATSAGAVPSATSTPGLYTDPNGAFSFSYPLTATVQNTTDADGSGTTLLVNAPAVATVGTTSAASAGASAEQVQVSISSFDENISLTAARIKKDIPTIVMHNVKTFTVGGAAIGGAGANAASSTQAVYFETATTREVWFVTGGYLYQVSGLLTAPRVVFDAIVAGFRPS